MKWLLISCFLLWARHGEGGALKCSPEDGACTIDLVDESIPQEIVPEISRRQLAECLPGSEWESNCHRCHCSTDGAADCLKRPGCHSKNEEPIRCKPNSTFKQDCNTCRCLESGQALCTLRLCQGHRETRLAPSKASLPQGVDCAPGTSWQSQCNDCACSPNGRRYCTEKACPGQESESLLRCAPQSQWKSECNTCWCVSGRAMCTKMGCSQPVQMQTDDKEEVPESEVNVMNKAGASDLNDFPEVDVEIEHNLNDHEKDDNIDEKTVEDNSVEGDILLNDHRKDHDNTKESVEDNLTRVNLKDLDDYDHNDLDNPIQTQSKILTNPAENSDSKANDNLELMEDVLNDNKNDEEDLSDADNQKGVNKDLEVSEAPYFDFNVQAEFSHRIQKRSACKPNQEFQNDCNTCKCSASGQSYSCTQNECMDNDKGEEDKEVDKEVEVFKEDEGKDHIEKHSVCKPGTTFYASCNPCHCNADGTDFSCTTKPCPLPDDVEVFHELNAVKTATKNATKKVCVENRMFIMNCNTCWCNEDGTSYFCTRKVCVQDASEELIVEDGKPENLRIVKRECRPDEVFELDCNMCRCNADGKSFSCTRRACFDEDPKNKTQSRKTRATPQEMPKACQPGQEFRLDCNKCLCDNDGQDFSCTRMDCAALNSNNNRARRKRDMSQKVSADCVPGSVFDQGCNVCRCTADGGHATCTLKRCAQNKDNSTASATESSFRCNPGEQFKQSCNDCSCSADGKSVFCTLLVCDEDLTPNP